MRGEASGEAKEGGEKRAAAVVIVFLIDSSLY
jgi:hypothetical protein